MQGNSELKHPHLCILLEDQIVLPCPEIIATSLPELPEDNFTVTNTLQHLNLNVFETLSTPIALLGTEIFLTACHKNETASGRQHQLGS